MAATFALHGWWRNS
ncbi:trp operon leader peptide [Salmonella enterica]|nr:trp operon leader peptide [Salmonella enterica]